LCDLVDVCDGHGSCIPSYAAAGTVCRAAIDDVTQPRFVADSRRNAPPISTSHQARNAQVTGSNARSTRA
jgi:hypothetical protein